MPESPQFRADRSFYDPAVEVTVTISGLDGPGALTCTQRVSREFAVDERLETPVIEEAAQRAVREIVDKALGGAREEKRERENPTDEVVDYTESAEHIARWDPARVLREVEAKRQIIDLVAGAYAGYSVLPRLALPYSDRPGYREEWKP